MGDIADIMINGDACYQCGQDFEVVGRSRDWEICRECYTPTIIKVSEVNKKAKESGGAR